MKREEGEYIGNRFFQPLKRSTMMNDDDARCLQRPAAPPSARTTAGESPAAGTPRPHIPHAPPPPSHHKLPKEACSRHRFPQHDPREHESPEPRVRAELPGAVRGVVQVHRVHLAGEIGARGRCCHYMVIVSEAEQQTRGGENTLLPDLGALARLPEEVGARAGGGGVERPGEIRGVARGGQPRDCEAAEACDAGEEEKR